MGCCHWGVYAMLVHVRRWFMGVFGGFGGVSMAIFVSALARVDVFKWEGRCSPVNGGGYSFSDAPSPSNRFTLSCPPERFAFVSFPVSAVYFLGKGDASPGSLSGRG